jgi:hypothetical protein
MVADTAGMAAVRRLTALTMTAMAFQITRTDVPTTQTATDTKVQ